MEKPTRLQFSVWSTAHYRVIRALIAEHEGLPVTLYLEPDNIADSTAVCVVCDPELKPFVVGGEARYIGPDGKARQYIGQLIGYVARSDPAKGYVAAEVNVHPVRAVLIAEGPDLFIEPDWTPPTEDVAPDGDIPF